MIKQQVNDESEMKKLFEWVADKKQPPNRKELSMDMDDAWKTYEVDASRFIDSTDDLYKLHPSVDADFVWTIHEDGDHQYWSSGTSSIVNRVGYYVAAKPVPRNSRILTSSQCMYCDKEECVCVKCSTCSQIEEYCECHVDGILVG